jgi:hypothetical protein
MSVPSAVQTCISRLPWLQKTLFQAEGNVHRPRTRVSQPVSRSPTPQTRVFRQVISGGTPWKRVFHGLPSLPTPQKRVRRGVTIRFTLRKRVFQRVISSPTPQKRVFRQASCWTTPWKRVFQTRQTFLSFQKTIGSRMRRSLSPRRTVQGTFTTRPPGVLVPVADGHRERLEDRRDLKGNPLCLSVASVVDPNAQLNFTTEATEEHRDSESDFSAVFSPLAVLPRHQEGETIQDRHR